MVQRYQFRSQAQTEPDYTISFGIVVTLTDLAIPRTNSINVTAIAKDDVTLTPAELTTTDDGPSPDDADSRVI